MINYYENKGKTSSDGKNKPSIVAVRKNDADIIESYKLSDGRILNKEQAVKVAKETGINGVNIGKTRGENPKEILRANPTNDVSKALYNLPTF